jgi:hypothetical protein
LFPMETAVSSLFRSGFVANILQCILMYFAKHATMLCFEMFRVMWIFVDEIGWINCDEFTEGRPLFTRWACCISWHPIIGRVWRMGQRWHHWVLSLGTMRRTSLPRAMATWQKWGRLWGSAVINIFVNDFKMSICEWHCGLERRW